MKKPKSFFVKICLFLALIVMMIDCTMLFLSFKITYDNTIEKARTTIKNAADTAVQYTTSVYLDNEDTRKRLSEDYSYLCDVFEITYIYAIKLDPDKRNLTYLAIGFGDDATQEAKETRGPGVVVEDILKEEELQIYNGESKRVYSHEKNQFGETLIVYVPCSVQNGNDTGKAAEHPIIIGAEISLTSIVKSIQKRFMLIAALTIGATLLMVVSFGVILYFRVSKPIRKISMQMNNFVSDRENQKNVEKLKVKGNDEFALMADSFNSMTDEIDRYINDIDVLTLEKHTQEAELNIARNIQMGLLQPKQTERDMFDIRGFMLPAKDVGGDLYDYRILDDGRIFVTVADVSGKGVSAALFMARAITLINQYAKMGYTPARMLEEYNNTLASQNPGGLFITTFVAIYDPGDGILTYSNAGHNIPYILSDTLIPLREVHGVAAGLFEGETYENARVKLKEGDTLFLYTDGVNEAKNADGGFYSTERLEKTLSSCIEAGSEQVLEDILGDLKRFVNGAEQNDDITMLSLHIKPCRDEVVLHLKSEPKQLSLIRSAIRKLPVSESLRKTLYLSAEEIFVNICSYAYDIPGDVEVRLAISNGVGMTFTDGGKPFDPTAEVIDIDEYDHENAIGGLGRFLTFSLAEQYRYEYRDGKNILYLFFKEVNENDDHKEN